ncbi:MAG: hypothetical protein ACI9XB_001059 [Gammaproteobacteria bacterium]|jgi:hypothetical protein
MRFWWGLVLGRFWSLRLLRSALEAWNVRINHAESAEVAEVAEVAERNTIKTHVNSVASSIFPPPKQLH